MYFANFYRIKRIDDLSLDDLIFRLQSILAYCNCILPLNGGLWRTSSSTTRFVPSHVAPKQIVIEMIICTLYIVQVHGTHTYIPLDL